MDAVPRAACADTLDTLTYRPRDIQGKEPWSSNHSLRTHRATSRSSLTLTTALAGAEGEGARRGAEWFLQQRLQDLRRGRQVT